MKDPWKKLIGNVRQNCISLIDNGDPDNPNHWKKPTTSQRKEAEQYQSGEIGYDELTGRNANKGATKVKKCYLQVDDLKYRWKIQEHKCAWFGFKLNPQDLFIPNHPLAISVDRIDDELDYTSDNIILCCRYSNLGRNVVEFHETKELIYDLVNRMSQIDYSSFSPGMEHTHNAVKPKTKTLW